MSGERTSLTGGVSPASPPRAKAAAEPGSLPQQVSRMATHEIPVKQLRALLLLLVLVPLIPTVLMVRFVIDAAQTARDAATERTSGIYRETLLKADASFAKHRAAREGSITPAEVHAFYSGLFDQTVALRVVDTASRTLAGPELPRGTMVSQTSLHDLQLPWEVQVWLVDQSSVRASMKEQLRPYAWTVIVAVIAIFSIAVAAGITVSRQLALHELKNTSIATVAHELRTPLASMRLLVDTLREGRYRGEAQLREYLDLIAAENLRLSQLTNNFLTLSRLERNHQALQFEPVAPRTIAELAVQALHARLQAPGVKFQLNIHGALPEVHADREAMVAVLTNLLDNALKYTEADKEIALSVRHDRGYVHFSVTDNGIGVPRSERRRIFKPFYQADSALSRTREGAGLGLSIVNEIVKAHRGQITVMSESGKGSTFLVMLPGASNRLV